MVTLGAAQYTYEVAEAWGQLPEGWSFREVAAVGVDAQNYVYAFNRGAHPMVVFDRHGHFVRSWGEGVFARAHGITMGPDATVFCTDDGDHTVRKCTLNGKVLFTLGLPGKPAPFMSGEPFHRCTHVALDSRTGEFRLAKSAACKNWCTRAADPGASRPPALEETPGALAEQEA